MAKLETPKKNTKFGAELIQGMKEALAHARGEIKLKTHVVKAAKPRKKVSSKK